MKNARKARSYGLYRHLRTSKEIIENLLNYLTKNKNKSKTTFKISALGRFYLTDSII